MCNKICTSFIVNFRFDGDNHKSSVYFLSHCHTDHMEGLDNLTNLRLINGNHEAFTLYTSPVSAEILKRLRPGIASKVKPLDIEVPTLIPVKEKFVCVTLIRAGHCPGSVMFLFEHEKKIILYTGDYRIHKNDFRKFNAFKYPSGALKRIDKIYLDTTFFFKCYPFFPSRQTCVKEVCNIIREWLEQSKNHSIQLSTSARYGYEDLLIEVSKELDMPIHVRDSDAEYKFFRCIPEMDNAVTLSGNTTPLHNNCGNSYGTVCYQPEYPKHLMKVIRFSAMLWTENLLINNETGVVVGDDGIIKVCYSTHASLEEGQALIKTLRPKAIEPCVVPTDGEKYEEMMELVDEAMKEYKEKNSLEAKCETETKLFALREETINSETNQNSCSEVLRNLLESPPRNRRKKLKQSEEIGTCLTHNSNIM